MAKTSNNNNELLLPASFIKGDKLPEGVKYSFNRQVELDDAGKPKPLPKGYAAAQVSPSIIEALRGGNGPVLFIHRGDEVTMTDGGNSKTAVKMLMRLSMLPVCQVLHEVIPTSFAQYVGTGKNWEEFRLDAATFVGNFQAKSQTDLLAVQIISTLVTSERGMAHTTGEALMKALEILRKSGLDSAEFEAHVYDTVCKAANGILLFRSLDPTEVPEKLTKK